MMRALLILVMLSTPLDAETFAERWPGNPRAPDVEVRGSAGISIMVEERIERTCRYVRVREKVYRRNGRSWRMVRHRKWRCS